VERKKVERKKERKKVEKEREIEKEGREREKERETKIGTCKPPVAKVTKTKAEIPCVAAIDDNNTVVANDGPVTPSGAPK